MSDGKTHFVKGMEKVRAQKCRVCADLLLEDDGPDTCNECSEDFLREVERRAGASREEMLHHVEEVGKRLALEGYPLCSADEWLLAILRGKP